jgi:hypothetical protein
MKRLSVLALSLLVLGAIPTIATAKNSPGKGPKKDLVVGTAIFPALPAFVHINAKSRATGQNPRGHFLLRQFGWQFRGSVTCMQVVGNRASVGGRVTRSSGVGAPAVGTGFVQFIEDNGSPGRNDRSETVLAATPPMICPAPITPSFVVAKGNYVVHDGT